jgi:NADP-dependent aldehyde dehydrogenase
VFAEMSSINPVLVLPQALANRSAAMARELTASVVQGCGQFCTNPGLVLGIRSPAFSACIKHLSGLSQAGNQAQPQLFEADISLLLEQDELLQEEVFGPCTVVVQAADKAELLRAVGALRGQLTATLLADDDDLDTYGELFGALEVKVGRVLLNGYPTGVEVCDAMVHGGPYPATSDARGTSVGTLAIDRFLRPVCYQNVPDALLPDALKNANPLGIQRLIDGIPSAAALS